MSQAKLRPVVVVLAVFAVLLGVLLLWGWLLTHPFEGSVGAVDDDVARGFAAHRTSTLTDAADAGTLVGETITGVVVLSVVALVFSVWRRSLRPGVFVAVMYGGMGLFYLVATKVDPRRRPPVKILDPGLVADHSFPSGHAGTAAAIAVCAALLLATYGVVRGRWLVALAVVPLFTGLSRLYLGAHHLTDVLTSLLLAPVWALVVARQVLPSGREGQVAD